MSTLNEYFRRWGMRLRLVQSLAWAAWGLMAGLALALALALAARVLPLLLAQTLGALALLLAAAGTIVGVVAAWLYPRSRHRLARIFDQRLGLAERLTTALEIGSGHLQAAASMAAVQLADTLASAGRADVRSALPARLPRRALLATIALAAALALSLGLPNPQEEALLRQAAVRTAVEEQIEALETVQDEIAHSEALTPEEREALLQALEEAIAALNDGRATPEEAVAALAEAERALAELQDPGAAGLQAGLDRAAGEMADSDVTRELSEALASGDYAAAAGELNALAGEKGQALTSEQELELAEELIQAAEALAGSDPELAAQLTEAAEAIQRGDIAAAREAIRQAAQQMAQAGEQIERQESVEQTLAALQEGRESIAQAGGT